MNSHKFIRGVWWRRMIVVVVAASVPGLALGAGDFNEDGQINEFDLRILLEQIEVGDHNPSFDVTGDGLVDGADLEFLIPSFQSTGDFNFDAVIDRTDANILSEGVASGIYDPLFDVDEDGVVNRDDILNWAHDKANTWIGDANFDGEFNSSDFVMVFQSGMFEFGFGANWDTGDWTGDLRFTSSDIVFAFQDGGFENGPRESVVVPEPTALGLALASLLMVGITRRRR